jgi:uncharacterized membrane protein YozB (DUF420 family)
MQWLRWHLEQHRAVIMTAAIIVTTFVGVFRTRRSTAKAIMTA